ncbi:MAG: ABC transporter substrate-binding protein [Rhizobiaceae bacterium MnEN-MB40S]|nr:MAG: ABC transporter substrate-binding protein [Rhizobiaceae bacterium MnEN-MB40S]
MFNKVTSMHLAGALAFGAAVAASPAGAQTLHMWGPEKIADPAVAEMWEKIADGFEATHPGVTIEYIAPTGTISNGAVQAAIQSDAGPDVVLTNSGIGRMTTVVNSKLVQPLTADYEAGWKDQVYPWLYEQLKQPFDGEIYEVPDGLDALAIWYHKDMFAEHGWEFPDSYDGFLELLQKIQDAGVQPIVAAPNNTGSAGHIFGNVLQVTAGSDVMGDVVSGEIPWTDDRVVAGLQAFADLVDKGYIQPEMAALNFDAGTRLFLSKRAAIFVGGPWFIGIAAGADYPVENLGYVSMPSNLEGESIPTGGIGWSYMIPTTSKQPDLAREWISYLLSDEVMKMRAEDPTSSAIYPRELKGVEPATPVMKDIFDAAAKGVGYNPSVYVPGSTIDTYYQVIQGLIGGQVSVEDGAAQIEAQMQQAK